MVVGEAPEWHYTERLYCITFSRFLQVLRKIVWKVSEESGRFFFLIIFRSLYRSKFQIYEWSMLRLVSQYNFENTRQHFLCSYSSRWNLPWMKKLQFHPSIDKSSPIARSRRQHRRSRWDISLVRRLCPRRSNGDENVSGWWCLPRSPTSPSSRFILLSGDNHEEGPILNLNWPICKTYTC